jgi:hypothetical protein
MRKFFSIFVIICFVFSAGSVLAYVMSSPNYRIQSDSLNVGGVRESSTNYRMEDTVGEIATGELSSATFKLKAGYQQMQEVSISLTLPSNVTMNPDIGGVTGGTSNGQAAWTTTTDNPAGYTLDIKVSTSPALKSGSYSFVDYTPVGSDPDYSWSVDAADSEFGFTPEGDDIVQKFKDDTSDCNTGSSDTADKCWYGLSISDETIAQSSSANHPSGTATTVKFQAQSGTSHLQEEGTYQATATVTATAN